jgi:sterol desaturase/sphingolipid hydroxylase (fatty acid hydroxylase superfamily)
MTRERVLKVVLVLVGLIFLVGVYPLMMYLWPSGWRWQPNQPEYEQMILGVYATLGIFLLLASRNPSAHRSLIAFTAWSSLVHAGIMAWQAYRMPSEHGHLLGDIPALVIVGIALIALAPAKHAAERPSAVGAHAT